MPRPWTCRLCGRSDAFRWLRNGRRRNGSPGRRRTCARCHVQKGPSLFGRATCPRCGGADIAVRPHPHGKQRHCRDCERRWGREAYRRNPEAHRETARRYRIRHGLAEAPEFDDLDEDPYVANARALDAALGRST